MNDSREDQDLDTTPPKQIAKIRGKHRQQKFRDAWLTNDNFKQWLMKVPNDQYKAKCRMCNDTMTAEVTVIKNHMASKKHLRNALEAQATISTFIPQDDDSHQSYSPLNTLWTYFSRQSSDKVQCTICQASVDVLDMHDHLRSEHPRVIIDESQDIQDFDNDASKTDDNDMYTEIVYLDESLQKSDKESWYKTPEKKRIKTEKYTQIVAGKKDKVDDDDEIERFITYQRCLLRQLPKNVASKLQRDIINMIMDEKMKIEERESAVNENNAVIHIRADLQPNSVTADLNNVVHNVNVITQD